MVAAGPAAILDAVLKRLLARHGGRQIFVFGSSGEPFWAARVPVTSDEFSLFELALDLIERLERDLPKPFFATDDNHRFVVAALDEDSDLYFVLLEEIQPQAAAARVTAVRRELLPYVAVMREEARRCAPH